MARSDESLDRRRFLSQVAIAAGLSATAATTADAVFGAPGGPYTPEDVEQYDFLLARIADNNPDWDYGPGGDRNLLEELSSVLRVKVKVQDNCRDIHPEKGNPEHFNATVDLSDYDSLRKYPFLFWTGIGAFRMRPKSRDVLKQYLLDGGSVLIDECAAPWLADDFYYSAYASLVDMFGKENVRPLPEDHEIYTNVHDISEPNFRRWKRGNAPSPGNLAAFSDNRVVAFLCDADIHCGWTDRHNTFRKRALYREGIMTGINVLAYFLNH